MSTSIEDSDDIESNSPSEDPDEIVSLLLGMTETIPDEEEHREMAQHIVVVLALPLPLPSTSTTPVRLDSDLDSSANIFCPFLSLFLYSNRKILPWSKPFSRFPQLNILVSTSITLGAIHLT